MAASKIRRRADALLADAVLLLHAAFIVWAALGGLAVWRWPRLAWAHLPCVAWGVWIEFSGGICPLTPLENLLRERAGQAGYGGDFIAHYLMPLIYPEALTRPMQWLLGAALLVLNLVIYTLAIRRRR